MKPGVFVACGCVAIVLGACGSKAEKPVRADALQFRILANELDDAAAIKAARSYFTSSKRDLKLMEEIDKAREANKPPSPPKPDEGKDWPNGWKYEWVEVGPSEQNSLRIANKFETKEDNAVWKLAKVARESGEAIGVPTRHLLYSRVSSNKDKKYDYFLLTRVPPKEEAVTGEHLVKVGKVEDPFAVNFQLSEQGGKLMKNLTSKNQPTKDGDGKFHRMLAVIVDKQIVFAPTLNSTIGRDGTINGDFTEEEVDRIVAFLKVPKDK